MEQEVYKYYKESNSAISEYLISYKENYIKG